MAEIYVNSKQNPHRCELLRRPLTNLSKPPGWKRGIYKFKPNRSWQRADTYRAAPLCSDNVLQVGTQWPDHLTSCGMGSVCLNNCGTVGVCIVLKGHLKLKTTSAGYRLVSKIWYVCCVSKSRWNLFQKFGHFKLCRSYSAFKFVVFFIFKWFCGKNPFFNTFLKLKYCEEKYLSRKDPSARIHKCATGLVC